MQGSRTGLDDVEAALEVRAGFIGDVELRQTRRKTACNRHDGREGIVEFVSENPNEALPGAALLLAQGATYIREHDQNVRHAILAE